MVGVEAVLHAKHEDQQAQGDDILGQRIHDGMNSTPFLPTGVKRAENAARISFDMYPTFEEASPVMRAKLAAAIALVVIAAAGGYWFWKGSHEASENPDNTPFGLVEAADREFDGAPALALTFSRPLDAGTAYDKYVQVFEMPARPGEQRARPQADDEEDGGNAWVVGANKAKNVSTNDADTETTGGKAVSGAWVVGENPRLLFFPHIKPQTRYVIRVAAGLNAKDGEKLNAESRFSVLTAAVSPAYYFASRGMVLPAKQNGGLPVVTVNVPEVDVQFLRVKPDQLPRFLDRVISGPAVKQETVAAANDEGDDEETPYYYDYNRRHFLQGAISNWELDGIHTMTESVYVGRFVTEQKPDRRGVTYLPVEDVKELRTPGVYIAVMTQPNRFRYDYQVTYFYVSDLGLHVRSFAKGADAFVSSLIDGKSVGGVEVSWLDEQGKVLARAETDGDGRANFAERPKGARVVLAKKDEQVSMIALKEPALDLSEYDIAGQPYKPVRLFAYSGRNLYRPGESFDVSLLARDADGRPVPAQPIQALLKRPDGKTQFTEVWKPDETHAGYFRRKVDLPADAPTGFWTLELRADPADKVPGTAFRFGVEEFLPERMKLDLAAEAPALGAGKPFSIDVKGAYLYGAPASGNRLLGVAQFQRNKNPLAQKLPGFEFGDADEESVRARVELAEDTLDEVGEASVDVDLGNAENRHSPFMVRATLSLLESGGRPIVRSIERTWWPAPALVGVRPLFVGDYAHENAPAQFEVVRADAQGKLLGGTALPVRLFREDRNYYWRFDDQRGWHSGFTETEELVESASVSVPAGGRAKLTLPVRYGRYRIEILDPETRQTLRYRFYAGWSAKGDETQGIRPDRVALKLDKAAYKDGESAQLTITPPHAGEALITVDGDRTLWVKRVSVPADGTTINLPVREDWKRHDLYVSVLVLRPGAEGEKVTPARALGLIPLPLDRAERKLAVTLDAPKKMEPDRPLKVTVKAPGAKGQKAMVTLSAVDAGILNITRFASPDPHGFFFGQLHYGADQYDVYGRLIEKMAGQKGKLKFGGDSAPKPTRSLPKKVRLVDLFSGPVALNERGEAEISLAVPDFNGTLRLMAVVAAPDSFGSQDAETVVAAPLVAELATPRFLSIGDSATIALDLQNLSGAAKSVKVSLSADQGLKIQNAERSADIKDQQKATLRFPVEAGTAFGLSEVKVNIAGPGIKLERSFALQVQAPTPQQQVLRRYTVAPGESVELKDAELSGFLRPTIESHVGISNRPPIDVRSAIHGLLTYPYGCAEQTTSTAYPHVFVDDEAARRFGLKPFSREQRADMLEKATGRLAAMQAPNGGFSLWGNASDYEYWLSAYVSNFLLDAREQNFNVPAEMQKKAMDFLLKALQEGVSGLPSGKVAYNENSIWNDRHFAGSGRFTVLAYGGYVLARESKAPLATLRQLYDSRELAHSGLALVHLGIALRLMGDEARGNAAIAEGIKRPREAGYWWGDYGSALRDAALSYALLDRHKLKPEGRENLLATISNEMGRDRYISTQEKLALFLVGRLFGPASEGGEWTATIEASGKEQKIATAGTLFRPVDPGDLAKGFKLRNAHKEPLYVELAVSGNPTKMPAAKSDLIALKRDFFAADGKPLPARALRVGETVIVRLTAKTRLRVTNGLVVDRIPAGLEIENLNIVQGEGMGAVTIDGANPAEAMNDGRIKHVEFRDDRFVAAVRFDYQPLTLFYRARVVTPGRFVMPPIYAEDMYRPDTFGLAFGGDTLTVTDGKTPAP
jgi:uncharacterized protein YfaS (alpha-2-macroglobulin family)